MKPGGGKAKGAAFERQVCKDLSRWYTAGSNEAVFWRSAISGGRATQAAKQGQNLAHVSGDLCAVHPLGYPFVERVYTECKFYRDLALIGLCLNLKSGINRHWTDCVTNANRYGKLPLLIARQNRTPPFVCLNSSGTEAFALKRYRLARIYPRDLDIFWYAEFLAHAARLQ